MKTGDKVILGGAFLAGVVGVLAYKGKLNWHGAKKDAPPAAPRAAAAHRPTGSAWTPPTAADAGTTSAPVDPSQYAAGEAGAGSAPTASETAQAAADSADPNYDPNVVAQ